MSRFIRDYHEATGYARTEATKIGTWFGVEAAVEYGAKGFRVFMIPANPNKRFGRDARCEPIAPGGPLSSNETCARRSAV